ncbi:sensor domain-containing diguanylate cyclase [Vibrio gangliei]|uniref:sensor domain-containing diguanylate cyclase n=1 Tax=Vibrio gangliei TaxID=2077090 RepID=UPI0013003069|nr:diguanylate cyclase [Vibrio gangliei]
MNTEYKNINKNLAHSVKLLSGMDYSFAVYFTDGSHIGSEQIQHTQSIGKDGLCVWLPKQREIQSAYRADARKVLQLDYAVKGLPEACDPETQLYQDIEKRVVLAPTFSFLNGVSDFILGLYYLSPEGYLIGSPTHLVNKIHIDASSIIKKREYWQEASNGISTIRVNGPFEDIATGKRILTISAGLFDKDKFRGVVALDILTSKLFTEGSIIGEKIKFIQLSNSEIPSTGWRPLAILIDGVQTNQMMYFDWNWLHEIRAFVEKRMVSLLMLVILYVIAMISLIYLKVSGEKKHFQNLSQRDPMTSLLNRRGFEVAYKGTNGQNYEALAIFDIDDFKQINDTYGHDIGDDVICAVAHTLNRNTRATDVVARFGGEEFVIYMQGNNTDKMLEAIERVQKEIGRLSERVLEQGYTVSAGMTIQLTSKKSTLEDLIKDADSKLYDAKRQGKDRVAI